MAGRPALLALATLTAGLALACAVRAALDAREPAHRLFVGSGECLACHNGLSGRAGEDVSIGTAWRASIMANSSRDPYWQAAVRREVTDYPAAAGEIQDECSTCHMPMARTQARAAGRPGTVFGHLPVGKAATELDALAADGVSCTLCHQIEEAKLGTEESFTGGFRVDVQTPFGRRAVFGPFTVDSGRAVVMRSATGFQPTAAAHIQRSELCATCHTLYTHARGPDGGVIGRLPEQVPYLEWLESEFRGRQSCQDCHMPPVEEATPITRVLGTPRAGLSRHVFTGGNFFVLRMLNRYRAELGVEALPHELEAAARRTEVFLATRSARVAVGATRVSGDVIEAVVTVQNLTGHKLPTAYPSRRAWLHLRVRDGTGAVVFESGAFRVDGSIAGNENDADPARYEPHYTVIERPDQVQVYESIMVGPSGAVTTGLSTGIGYAKDNRLLPRGFDKARAHRDVAVHGAAAVDPDFVGGEDRVRYRVQVAGRPGPFEIDARLWYQPIGFRWAKNLDGYDSPEPRRFVAYFDSMASSSAVVLARAVAQVR